MLTKILCAALLLPFVCSFAVPQEDHVSEPYFSHPRDKHLSVGPRLIGGEEVVPHSYPFQVSLFLYKSSDVYFCGGSLISSQWVLTAAHCVVEVNPDYILVGLGQHNLNNISSTAVIMNTTTYIGHEDYNPDMLQNDVALVRLPHNVTFTPYIQPIALASGGDKYAGDNATYLGWGQTETESLSLVLRRVNATLLSNTECANINANYELVIRDTHLCASGYGNVGICSGDSGGPLIVNGVQVGITSFGTKDCQLSMPSVFTRITEFYEWIVQNAQDRPSFRDGL